MNIPLRERVNEFLRGYTHVENWYFYGTRAIFAVTGLVALGGAFYLNTLLTRERQFVERQQSFLEKQQSFLESLLEKQQILLEEVIGKSSYILDLNGDGKYDHMMYHVKEGGIEVHVILSQPNGPYREIGANVNSITDLFTLLEDLKKK